MNTTDWRNATPEQKNLWRAIPAIFAFNTIEPFCYTGAMVGNELTVYDAAKLYFCLKFSGSYTTATPLATYGWAIFYNEANVAHKYIVNEAICWDVTAAVLKAVLNALSDRVFYFSRVSMSIYTMIEFNGYRLTIV